MADRPRVSPWRKTFGCIGCLGVALLSIIGLVVAVALVGDGDAPEAAAPGPVAPPGVASPPAPTPGPSVAVGEEGVLERPGAEGAWMTVSLDDYRALVAAERKIEAADADVRAAGKMARVALGLSRRMKVVRNGTRVRVRGAKSGGLYVEALDGADVGRSGWVDSWSVRALPAAAGVRGRGA
jgi:hypothetical protein